MQDYPAQFIALMRQRPGPYFFWRSPEGEVLMAAGMRTELSPPSAREWRTWSLDVFDSDPETPTVALLFFSPTDEVSAEWDGFPPVRYYQPEAAVHVREGSRRSWGLDDSALTGAPLDPRLEADEEGELIIRAWDEAAYRARVEEALLLLKDGRLEKVVLARMSTIQFSRSFRLYEALHAMEGQPNAFSICWSPDGARFFLSATPERLGRVHEGQFETMALAGTLTRQDGRSVEDLLSDAKERTEHNYVVEMICSAAADFASEVGIRDVRVLELPHVTHILTRIGGRMHAGCSLRHVIAALHPTPAVAGTPRPAAQELITRLEPFDRGLYAGCVGWYIGESEGDAAVTIRSALVSGREALVWAGAGIVGKSDARAEERETRAKLQTMLDILGSAC